MKNHKLRAFIGLGQNKFIFYFPKCCTPPSQGLNHYICKMLCVFKKYRWGKQISQIVHTFYSVCSCLSHPFLHYFFNLLSVFIHIMPPCNLIWVEASLSWLLLFLIIVRLHICYGNLWSWICLRCSYYHNFFPICLSVLF